MKATETRPAGIPPFTSMGLISRLLLVASSLLLASHRAAAQTVVPLGAGSYASSVPAGVADTDGYYALPANQVTGPGSFYDLLHLDPALRGRPLPTNQWWTDLLVGNRSGPPAGTTDYSHIQYNLKQDAFSGNLWTFPGRVNAKSYGLDLYYPKAWKPQNAAGTNAAIDPGPVLAIHGDRGHTVPPEDILVADFESGYPAGWTSTAVAGRVNPFPAGPARTTWTGALPTGTLGGGYASSQLAGPTANRSDANQGILSGSFTLQRRYLHLLVGGGSDPVNTVVRLRVNGSVVASASGQQNTKLAWVSWDVSAYLNQTATIELVDTSNAAYGFILCDQIVQSDVANPAARYGSDFISTGAVVTNWGDWNVDFKLPSEGGQEVDVTLARGVPFTWTTWKNGLKPQIFVSGTTRFLDAAGNAIPTTGGAFVASAFAFDYQGRTFGVFLPDNTTVTVSGNFIEPQLAGANNYLVIGCLPAASNLAEFAAVAYARPTGTKLSWSYNPAEGSVVTDWDIATTPLKGSNLNTIQGWLPHHTRTTAHNLPLAAYSYLTARGTMRCATGNHFTIRFPFRGIVPVLPAPSAVGGANDFQPARMQSFINGFNPGNMVGETYGSGKGMGLCSQFMAWADQSGDTANRDRLKTALEAALADWFTYTPGEARGFFSSYPDWHALIGFDASYGSQAFNDLHFHYGYFAMAAATLGMVDPQFLNDYGPMLRLVVKSFANFDRNDPSDPFLRTFDVWEGHSNAGGLSDGGGENQESSSEAVQSWAALFLLGGVTNDQPMTAAGAMGFAMESAATNEYWQDLWGTNFPADYTRAWDGQVWADHNTYATYFSADPAWIYGIQMVPSNHLLNYLTRYQPAAAAASYDAMWTERNAWAAGFPAWSAATAYKKDAWINYNNLIYNAQVDVPAGGATPGTNNAVWYFQADCTRSEPDVLGGGLGQYVLTYQALFDPDTAAAEFDRYFAAKEPIATGGGQAGACYYLIHAMRQLGLQDSDSYTSAPLSAVYRHPKTGQSSYLAYNPTDVEQNVTVYQNGAAVGAFRVPARRFINSHLDQALDHVVLTTSNPARTIQPGQVVQFTLTGYDQYGATFPLTGTQWSVNAGGTITSTGRFTATANADPVTVTAVSGGLAQSLTFRVGAAPGLSRVVTVPGFTRVINGATQPYAAAGLDQYGDPFPLNGGVTWSVNGSNGTVDSNGRFTATALGTGYVRAESGGLSASTLVVVHAPLTNIALGRPATVSTTRGSSAVNTVTGNVTDGKTSTRWESEWTDGQSITVDLGKVYDLASVNIVWQSAYAKVYDVETATTLTGAQPWTVVAAPPTKTSSAADNLPLTGATGRYLKLNLVTRANPSFGFVISEVGVYGYPTAAGITPTALRVGPGNVTSIKGRSTPFQAYAFDANLDGGPTAAATWAVNGGGTINAATGLFSATTVGGPFTVTATLGPLTATAAVTVVNAPDPGTPTAPFAAWQSRYFTPAELANPAVSGPDATPAGDGITNRLKYALGLDPKRDGTAGLPKVGTTTVGSQAYLTLTYTCALAASDVTVTVEASSDLQTWTSGAGQTTVVSTTDNPDGRTQTIVARDLTAVGGHAERFLRLKVTTP